MLRARVYLHPQNSELKENTEFNLSQSILPDPDFFCVA